MTRKRTPSFLKFLTGPCRFEPTPAQRALVRVAFDDADPDDEMARTLFGDVDHVPPEARRVVSITKGARIGGTRIAALYLLFRGAFSPLATLAPGELAAGLIVGPDLRLARQALRYARGAAGALPDIARAITKDGEDGFTFTRPDGRSVTIECLPATRGGSAVRGRSLVGAVMTEAAFFRDASSGVVNDEEIKRAIVPRLMPGAKLVIESTPWLASGVLYENDRQWGQPSTCLAARAPTLLMRPSAEMEAFVNEERARDPDNARREFDAQFLEAGAGLFFDGQCITRSAIDSLPLPLSPFTGPCGIGGDLGLAADSSAVALVQWDRSKRLVVAVLDELKPSPGAPLQIEAVTKHFATVTATWRGEKEKHSGASTIWLDTYERERAREHFATHKIEVRTLPGGGDGKFSTYQRFRELLHGGLVVLPNHPRLIAQLRSVTVRPLSGGGVKIESPRRAGMGHGDLVSALVAAVHALDHTSVTTGARGGYQGSQLAASLGGALGPLHGEVDAYPFGTPVPFPIIH
jgi:hypothetical protein